MNKPFKTTIVYCARCGQDHEQLEFKPLTNPITETDGPVEWTHWAPCPTNGEPILLRTFPTGNRQQV